MLRDLAEFPRSFCAPRCVIAEAKAVRALLVTSCHWWGVHVEMCSSSRGQVNHCAVRASFVTATEPSCIPPSAICCARLHQSCEHRTLAQQWKRCAPVSPGDLPAACCCLPLAAALNDLPCPSFTADDLTPTDACMVLSPCCWCCCCCCHTVPHAIGMSLATSRWPSCWDSDHTGSKLLGAHSDQPSTYDPYRYVLPAH